MAVLPQADEDVPDWWRPYAAEFPHWHAWRGIAGLLYARRPRSGPPKTVRAAAPGGLAQAVRRCEHQR